MKLRVATADLNRLHAGLLANVPGESAAFLSAEPAGDGLVARAFHVFAAEDLEPNGGELGLTEGAQNQALAAIKRAGHALVEVHTHPGSGPNVAFSRFDTEQLRAFSRYLGHKLPGRPFGALVFSEQGWCGQTWAEGHSEPLVLQCAGEAAATPAWLGPPPDPVAKQRGLRRFDRQIRALGSEGQARLEGIRVGIVGLGGTGSQVVQQLAHLGVAGYVLVEDDQVDATGVHRLAGSSRWDARRRLPKAALAARTIRRQNRAARIASTGCLRRRSSLGALKDVDLIIGCVDNDGARLVTAELAAAYLVPYLDLGVGIAAAGDAQAMGGRVSFYLPGGPCLACADELDFAEAAEDLESEELHRIRLRRGYAQDRRIEPAIMPLNAIVASQGMMELLAFATGFRPVAPFLRYDATKCRLTRDAVTLNPDCPVCQPAHGMGNRRAIERYALD